MRDLEKNSSEGEHANFLDAALVDRFSKKAKVEIDSIPEANAADEISRHSVSDPMHGPTFKVSAFGFPDSDNNSQSMADRKESFVK